LLQTFFQFFYFGDVISGKDDESPVFDFNPLGVVSDPDPGVAFISV
jgi:hypothetical protein